MDDAIEDIKWRKSSLSASGNCVEVANGVDRVLVRDSKNPGGPRLEFTTLEWRCFVEAVRLGEFDPLPF